MYYSQNMSTYKELCSIANDLNQPDLIYKFLHLANHQATWNTKQVRHIAAVDDVVFSFCYLAFLFLYFISRSPVFHGTN